MYPGAYVESHAERPAVIMASTGWTQTFGELDSAANRVAHLFRSVGFAPGDHVAICLENHPRYLEILWGCEYAGLIYTAVSSRLTSDELAYIVDDCGARGLIASAATAEMVTGLSTSCPKLEHRWMLDGSIEGFASYEQSVATCSDEPLPTMTAGADMLYSSGTTGRPKGVLPRFEPQPIGERKMAVATLLELLFAMTGHKIYLSPAPLYHAAPLRFCLSTHALGSTVVVMDRFEPVNFLATVETYKATHCQMVPTMFVRLLKLPTDERDRFDVSSLEMVVHAAAPCPIPVKEAMIDWFGPIIHEYYAGTEGNGFVYCNSEMWLAHKGTVGTPVNCELHIVDDDGTELPTGQPGTVYMSGGNTFEYHNDPEKTAASRHPDGWSTLGDIGYVDDDGFLYLTDRKAYMIISGGVNIYPQEAESALTMHPDVVDVAVFGVPHDEFGEEVTAVVQPVTMPSDASAAQQLEADLIRYCRSQIADFKCPRSVSFREELPRHPTGKLYKRLLVVEAYEARGLKRE